MYIIHGCQVLVAHVQQLAALPLGQVGGAVLQGGGLFILVPVFLWRGGGGRSQWRVITG